MADCISLIDTRASHDDINKWTQVSQMRNVIHTEEIEILSVAGGNLEIEPFCVLGIDCRIVGALVYHCCGTGAIHSWEPEVISHVFQSGPDTCVKLDCWSLTPKQYEPQKEYCWVADPCERLHLLRCCEVEWLKAGKKKDWSFRDSSGSTEYLSTARLKELIMEAESACDAQNCVNTRCVTFRCSSGYC